MGKYRNHLPQITSSIFLTDGGLETDLIFNKGIELPEFAAFDLLNSDEGKQILKKYYEDYLIIAKEKCEGFVLELPTYRANPDWVIKLGYSIEYLTTILNSAINELEVLRSEFEDENFKIPISFCIGPRGDGYVPESIMTIKEAEDYHSHQIQIVSKTNADLVSALTMNYNEEAIGIANAAKKYGIPAVILITVCVVSALLTEMLMNKMEGESFTIGDGSAAITGLLLALTLPPSLSLSAAALGSIFAIAIGKQVFGGLGYNIFNPALLGRAFLQASFPVAMTTWTYPQTGTWHLETRGTVSTAPQPGCRLGGGGRRLPRRLAAC